MKNHIYLIISYFIDWSVKNLNSHCINIQGLKSWQNILWDTHAKYHPKYRDMNVLPLFHVLIGISWDVPCSKFLDCNASV